MENAASLRAEEWHRSMMKGPSDAVADRRACLDGHRVAARQVVEVRTIPVLRAAALMPKDPV